MTAVGDGVGAASPTVGNGASAAGRGGTDRTFVRRFGGELPRAFALLVTDLLAINLGFAAAYVLRYRLEIGGAIEWYNRVEYREYAPWGAALSVILVVAYFLEGLYGRRRTRSLAASLYALSAATLVGVALLAIVIFGLRPAAQSRLMLPYATVLIIFLLALVRVGDVLLARRRLRRGEGVQRVLIVGAGRTGRSVMGNIVAQPGLGFRIVGFLDDDVRKRTRAIGRFDPLGGTGDLDAALALGADMVIIALPWRSREKIAGLVARCEAAGVSVRIVPDLFQMSLNRVDVDSLSGIPLIAVREPAIRGWDYRVKRALDVAVSVTALLLLAPLAGLIALAIRIESPGPVHFRQPRLGRDGRVFTCLKFRSMRDGADGMREQLAQLNEATGAIFKIRNDPRLTRVGRVLRRTSLDELPQLWNVLRGDMSLVGPRPPMPDELKDYAPWHLHRLDVAPGMTGLWQVSGRSRLTFDEMVLLDLFYAENWSLALDVQIMLRTLPSVLRGEGAY